MTTTQNEATNDLNNWLQPTGPVALYLRQRLLPVEADEQGRGVIFPPTYADIGYNIDTLSDGTQVATIDSVGSQANRMEPLFKRPADGDPDEHRKELASLVPQIEIDLGSGERVSLLDLGHRSADAVVRACKGLNEQVKNAFEELRKGNAAPLAAIAPTSLVFGVWDSRGSSGEKRPRLVRSIVRAWDVERLSAGAQYNSIWKALSKGAQTALQEEAKKKKVKLSEKGFADAPAQGPKGGVLVKGHIERDVTVNLVALRGLRGKDNTETVALQRYLLGLCLLAATADMNLYFREGCLLRLAEQADRWLAVPRRGEPVPVDMPSRKSLVEFTKAAMEKVATNWPDKLNENGERKLLYEFKIDEAKKLLATKDDDTAADS